MTNLKVIYRNNLLFKIVRTVIITVLKYFVLLYIFQNHIVWGIFNNIIYCIDICEFHIFTFCTKRVSKLIKDFNLRNNSSGIFPVSL